MSAVTSVQAHETAIKKIDDSLTTMHAQLRAMINMYKDHLDNVADRPDLGIGTVCGTTHSNIIQLVSRIAELMDQREYHKIQIIEVTYVPMVDDDGRPYHKVGG